MFSANFTLLIPWFCALLIQKISCFEINAPILKPLYSSRTSREANQEHCYLNCTCEQLLLALQFFSTFRTWLSDDMGGGAFFKIGQLGRTLPPQLRINYIPSSTADVCGIVGGRHVSPNNIRMVLYFLHDWQQIVGSRFDC